MGEARELVWFEVQGTIRLAAVAGGGERRVVLLDGQGESHKLSRRKVLYTLKQPAPDPLSPEAMRALRAGALAAVEPLEVERELYPRLEDGPRYSLSELAQAACGRVDDEAVARVVAGLLEPDGRVVDCLRLRKGGFVRLDPETLAHLRVARAREARERAEDDAFLAWFGPLREGPPVVRSEFEPPAEHSARLETLLAYARAADKSPQAKAGRRLLRRLELDDADALLGELERMGILGPHTNVLPHRHGVPVAFRAEAQRAAEELSAREPPRLGQDLRDRPTVAIDDAFTRDVDDALSAWEEDGQTWFAVHIAHVAHAVVRGGSLDREARRRVSSLYFPDETIPMLPWGLTESYASLEAGQDRPAVSLLGRVGPGGVPEELRFQVSHVRVDCRLDYVEDGPPRAETVKRSLLPLARALRERRREQGAVILDLPQVKMRLERERWEARPEPVRQDTLAHLVVSELMVLYNAELGRWLAQADAPALFRVQPRPVRQPEGDPRDPLFPLTSRRGLPPTTTDVRPGPHRTLGVEHYVQGTSPIRRYGDLLAQRQLLALLAGDPPAHTPDEVLALRQEIERRERRARTLEDERERYWIARWLADQPEPHAGYVSRLEPRRTLVYLPALRREFPCRLDVEAHQVGEEVRVRPRQLDPRSLAFELAE